MQVNYSNFGRTRVKMLRTNADTGLVTFARSDICAKRHLCERHLHEVTGRGKGTKPVWWKDNKLGEGKRH